MAVILFENVFAYFNLFLFLFSYLTFSMANENNQI